LVSCRKWRPGSNTAESTISPSGTARRRPCPSVVEDYLSAAPELLRGPIRVTIEHEAPIALGDKLAIIAHVHPAGSTDKFGPGLVDRTVTTLTYADGDETRPSHPSLRYSKSRHRQIRVPNFVTDTDS
jgi:hypothetical protein